ncbi:MAG: PadR family transcriptional regulator, partial [Rubrobacter sp.]|nr:PadR family transcriptional regulator [Rubrobacter sp.]
GGEGEIPIEDTSVTPKEIFLSEVKSKTIFPLLVLHMLRKQPEYGNSIIKKMGELTDGAMTVSPNTIYPLLRRLEEKGYIVGEWENQQTRSRRYYSITESGEEKYQEVKELFETHLLRVKSAIEALQREMYG